MNWVKELEACGIPADRVKLVERNVELKAKLKARGVAIQGAREAHHETFNHEGPVETCPHGVCSGLLSILNRTEA